MNEWLAALDHFRMRIGHERSGVAIGSDAEKNDVKHRNSARCPLAQFGEWRRWLRQPRLLAAISPFQTMNFMGRYFHRTEKILFSEQEIAFGVVGEDAPFVGPKKFNISKRDARLSGGRDNFREKSFGNSPARKRRQMGRCPEFLFKRSSQSAAAARESAVSSANVLISCTEN